MSKHADQLLSKLEFLGNYVSLWNRYFTFFSDEQTSVPQGPDAEYKFLQVTQALMFDHYRLSEDFDEDFEGAGTLLKLVQNNPSLEAIRAMPDTEYDRMQVSWHETFLQLNKARGKVEHKVPLKSLEAWRASKSQSVGAHPAGHN